jgi:hypothetical protein
MGHYNGRAILVHMCEISQAIRTYFINMNHYSGRSIVIHIF